MTRSQIKYTACYYRIFASGLVIHATHNSIV